MQYAKYIKDVTYAWQFRSKCDKTRHQCLMHIPDTFLRNNKSQESPQDPLQYYRLFRINTTTTTTIIIIIIII